MVNIDNNFQMGELVTDWAGAGRPERICHSGRFVRLEPLQTAHLEPLFRAFRSSPAHDWYYVPFGPFADQRELENWGHDRISSEDPLFFVILGQDSDDTLGFLSFLNIRPDCGSIEIGFIQLSTKIQRTTGATEAIWLLVKHAFEIGYRRVEWKCDSLNERSRKAALRLGFEFEGVFRQALVVKGRNRDTAWFSIIDKDWRRLDNIYCYWFENANSPEAYVSLSKLINETNWTDRGEEDRDYDK